MARKTLMKGFKRPKSNFEQVEHNSSYGKFLPLPLNRGSAQQ